MMSGIGALLATTILLVMAGLFVNAILVGVIRAVDEFFRARK
jgi:hypothetical protein